MKFLIPHDELAILSRGRPSVPHVYSTSLKLYKIRYILVYRFATTTSYSTRTVVMYRYIPSRATVATTGSTRTVTFSTASVASVN